MGDIYYLCAENLIPDQGTWVMASSVHYITSNIGKWAHLWQIFNSESFPLGRFLSFYE